MSYRHHDSPPPTDEQIAKEGFRAFVPKGVPLRGGSEEEARLMEGMGAVAATGDPDELRAVAAPIAYRMNPYTAWIADVDDDEPGPGWLI